MIFHIYSRLKFKKIQWCLKINTSSSIALKNKLVLHCTEVRFANFQSGRFTTGIVVNPSERKLAKRTSVHCTAGSCMVQFFGTGRKSHQVVFAPSATRFASIELSFHRKAQRIQSCLQVLCQLVNQFSQIHQFWARLAALVSSLIANGSQDFEPIDIVENYNASLFLVFSCCDMRLHKKFGPIV